MKTPWLLLQLLYWRRYARSLERQLEGEKARNQAREDEMMTVPMRMLGMYGVATREGPAPQLEPLRRQVQRKRTIPAADGWAMLTDDERAEWETWREDVNPSPDQMAGARREFLEMIRLRRMGNEEIM